MKWPRHSLTRIERLADMLLPDGSEAPPTFPIVCIGGSAGSLCAYADILGQLPKNAGLAVVIVSHRPLSDINLLVPLLTKAAHMKVIEATDGTLLEPGCIFVAPPHRKITTDGTVLKLSDGFTKLQGWPTLISEFLMSLADTCGSRVIAIVLSGMGYDGSHALATVKSLGGWTLAQSDAQFPGMPQAAIDTNHVDFVLRSMEIGKYLTFLSMQVPTAIQ